jgi:hypothetical protein
MAGILTLRKGVETYLAAANRIYYRRSRSAPRRAQGHCMPTAAHQAADVSAPVTK